MSTTQNVTGAVTLLYGTQGSGNSTMLIVNLDSSNTIWVNETSQVQYGGPIGVPVQPGASISMTATQGLWAVCAPGVSVQIALIPNGTSYFFPASLSSLGGVKVYIQAGRPTGTPPVGSLWLQTTVIDDASVVTGWNYWDGTDWVPQTFNATDVITAGTIIANLIAAGSVFAGIVNGTTIQGAMLISDGTGIGWVVYNGTPAKNNVLLSQSVTYTTDSFGNQIPAGLTSYSSAQPGAAQNIAWGGITSCLQNASGVTSQQGAWNFPADYWQDQSYFFTSVPLAAQLPGGAANTPAGWETVTPTGSWTVVNPLQVKLYPDNTVGIRGELTASAAISSGATLMTLGTGYVPTTEARLTWNYNTSAPAVDPVIADVSTGGVIKTYAGVPSGATLNISGRIPLD